MKKLATMLLLIAVVVTAIPAVGAEAGRDSYIVRMEGAPLIAYEGNVEGLPATKPASGAKLNLNSAPAMQYKQYLEASHNQALEGAGVKPEQKVHTYFYALNGFSAIMTEAQAAEMAKQPGVVAVMPDQMRYPTQDSEPSSLTVTDPAKLTAKGYDGSGVVVGIIDTGIWPEHPSFADDGSYPPPPITLDDSRPNCEFGNEAHNPLDVPFTCNNKLIGARQMLDTYRALIGADSNEYDSARDDAGHGTHTASTAAGNANVRASVLGIPRGKISGIAPRAHVVAYKGLGYLGGFTSDLAAAIDQAVADGVDVINYSIGGGAGTPGADEIAFLFAADAGVFVATSAGNSGPGAATLGNPGTMPWMTTVGADTPKRVFYGKVWLGDKTKYYGASITGGTSLLPLVDAADYGNELCDPALAFADDVSGKIVLCRRGATARADKSRAVYEAGGAGMIMYNNDDVGTLASDSHWVPSVHIDQTPGLAIKAYIASVSDPEAMIFGGRNGTLPESPIMTKFSSRGPNPVSPDIIKPDISAIGTHVLAGYSPTSYEVYDVPGELYAAIQGTSMSSPIVAGTFALLKQAHPDWSPAMARSAIMTTADQGVTDNDRVSPADPFDMGAGHLNIGERWTWQRPRSHVGSTMNMSTGSFSLGGKVKRSSIFQPGLVYDAGLFDYAAYTCGEDFGVFTPGSCDFLASLGIPSDPSDLNYPSIGIGQLAGSQMVQRTVTSVAKEKGWREYKVSVEAPEGYAVTVEPSTFKLKSGESATYYVTITNETAPVGEWRFGSLTWKDKTGHYGVRSPIAVNAALFDAPAEVGGSGVDGSASFDVSFGYTGSYAAAPHGLTADTPTSGEIGQDPDQTYPSDDDSPVGVQRIDYTVSGAAFVRWEMVIPGDDDIDLYLEDSSGAIIATSTSGGTDELIEMFLPADDTYTMVVHGWSVPSAPLPYTLHYWEVPLASGGSLSVDAAPASATIGVLGTIDISWSGLTAGTTYLGAVSHTGDDGLMGLTLVNVDTQ